MPNQIFESLLACFLYRKYTSYSCQYMFTRKYWQKYFICVKMLLLKKMLHVLISKTVVKI